jgi:hypothetical protein
MILLPLASIALLGVIAYQDWKVPTLRNATVSSGLTGQYHALLDASYVPLSVALLMSFHSRPLMAIFAVIAAISLLMVAATNTAWAFFNSITDGEHSLWHTRFTIAVFVSGILLQVAGDSGWRWALTAATIAVPAAACGYFAWKPTVIKGTQIAASPAAEKLYIAGLCIWLAAWG